MPWDRTTLQAFPSSEVSHLHLLRHGKPDTDGQRRCYGHADLPLSAEGYAQSDALLVWAVDHLPKPDRILSSDLSRALTTARALAERFDVPLTVDPDLREQHMGDWEGAHLDRPHRGRHHHRAGILDRLRHNASPGREPGRPVCARGARAERHWPGHSRGGRTVVVAHAG